MDVHIRLPASAIQPPSGEEMEELRRGPWTVEEDLVLIKYITEHGDGQWNALARLAGLKRTGKSCRLRWLNYLRPDIRRGNITPDEQLLILELQSRWGNRWSKIARCLPGRTDNEIKNYWRTRVQKHAKQLRCDVNSKTFRDATQHLWMPRLLERIRAASGRAPSADPPPYSLSQLLRPFPEKMAAVSSSSTSTSEEDSLLTQFSTFTTVQGGEMIQFDEQILDVHVATGAGWTQSPSTCPTNYGDFEQGGWASADLLSGDYMWSIEDL
ncbi:unnamed protein product [Musa textilis]